MSRKLAYQLLGYVVWKDAKWYLRRRVREVVPFARVAAGVAIVGLLVAGGAAALARGDDDPAES